MHAVYCGMLTYCFGCYYPLQNGAHPLLYVSLCGRQDLVELLLQHHATVDLASKVSLFSCAKVVVHIYCSVCFSCVHVLCIWCRMMLGSLH